jgi:hypothetical protein
VTVAMPECAIAERVGRDGGPRLIANIHDD